MNSDGLTKEQIIAKYDIILKKAYEDLKRAKENYKKSCLELNKAIEERDRELSILSGGTFRNKKKQVYN